MTEPLGDFKGPYSRHCACEHATVLRRPVLLPDMGVFYARNKQHLLDLIDGKLSAECGGMFPDIDQAIDEFRERVAAAEFKEGGSDD